MIILARTHTKGGVTKLLGSFGRQLLFVSKKYLSVTAILQNMISNNVVNT
jgi:hypothetical protein